METAKRGPGRPRKDVTKGNMVIVKMTDEVYGKFRALEQAIPGSKSDVARYALQAMYDEPRRQRFRDRERQEKQVGFRMDDAEAARLQLAAARLNLSRAAMVKYAIERLYDRLQQE